MSERPPVTTHSDQQLFKQKGKSSQVLEIV